MKTFSFYVPSENFTYSFELPSKIIGGQEHVETAGLRHPDFRNKNSLIASEEVWQQLEEFKTDFNLFVSKIIASGELVTNKLIDSVMYNICAEHIKKFGRLMYVDLLGYADLSTFINKAVFEGPLWSYHSHFRLSVYKILDAFPRNVLFQGPLGTLYSWEDVPDIP